MRNVLDLAEPVRVKEDYCGGKAQRTFENRCLTKNLSLAHVEKHVRQLFAEELED
jgi:hypothetical protein